MGNVGPLLNRVGDLVMKDMKSPKVQGLATRPRLLCLVRFVPRNSRSLTHECKEDLPQVEDRGQVKEHLNRLDINEVHRHTQDLMVCQDAPTSAEGAGQCHWENALDYLGRSLVIKRGELENWKKAKVTFISKKSQDDHTGKYRPVSFISTPEKMIGKVILAPVSKNEGWEVSPD